MHFIYFLRSLSNPEKVYTGMATDPLRRLEQHNRGENVSTRGNVPWEIEASFMADTEETARIAEKYFKNSAGKEKFTRFAEANPDNPNPKQGFFDALEEGRGFGKGKNRIVVQAQGSLKYFYKNKKN